MKYAGQRFTRCSELLHDTDLLHGVHEKFIARIGGDIPDRIISRQLLLHAAQQPANLSVRAGQRVFKHPLSETAWQDDRLWHDSLNRRRGRQDLWAIWRYAIPW